MKTTLYAVISLIIVMASTVVHAAQYDSVTPPPPIAVDVQVINDESSPVPVVGDVNANVSGAVAVNSVPPSLTDQLDTLIEEVQKLSHTEQEVVSGYLDFILEPGNLRMSTSVPAGVVITDIAVTGQLTNGGDYECWVTLLKDNADFPTFPDRLFTVPVPYAPFFDRATNFVQFNSGLLSTGDLSFEVALFSSSPDIRDDCRGTLLWSGYYQ